MRLGRQRVVPLGGGGGVCRFNLLDKGAARGLLCRVVVGCAPLVVGVAGNSLPERYGRRFRAGFHSLCGAQF